jgi:tetratricopeptide (TPR) repeat protein
MMDVPAIHIPPTVQALLAGRIDRLPPEEKLVLQASSVIGRDVPVTLLQALFPRGEADLRRSLARLQAAEFLYETRLFPELEYSFKHALTHEAAYAGLLHERRRALHLSIVDALEQRAAVRPAQDAERLARHAVAAEVWDKGARYLRLAAQRAIARSSYGTALEQLQQSLQALERLPETPETLAQAIDTRLELRVPLIPLGRYHDVLAVMREAEVLATRLGDRARLGRVLADISARLRNVTGEHRRAIEVGQRALDIAAESGDRALEIEALYRTGQAHFAVGDYRRAFDLLSRCAKGANQDDRQLSPLFAPWSSTWLALTLASLGRFDEARTHARRALSIAERVDHPFTVAETLTGMGGIAIALGECDAAIEALDQAHVIVRAWKLQPWAVLGRLGYSFALSGRVQEGRELLEEVVRSATTMSSMGVGRAMQLAWLGEAYVLEGRFDEALRHGHEGLALSRSQEERGDEGWCMRLLGEIASRREPGNISKGEGYYRQALALADELGMRPLAAHCHSHLAELLEKERPGQASEHRLAAATMCHEMGMRIVRTGA